MNQSLADFTAAQLRAEMARRELTPTDLGRVIGVSETWVRRRMRRQRDISMDDLDRIAVALNLPASFFVIDRDVVAA
jgi:transcriptional regulator with XRE-family HTH domain